MPWLSAAWRRPRAKCSLQSSSARGVEGETAAPRSPMRWLSWRCPAATPGWSTSSLPMRRIMTSSWCWNSEFAAVLYTFVLKCNADRKECEAPPLRANTFLSNHREPLTLAAVFHLQSSFSPTGLSGIVCSRTLCAKLLTLTYLNSFIASFASLHSEMYEESGGGRLNLQRCIC